MTYQFKIGQRVKCITKTNLGDITSYTLAQCTGNGYISPEGIGYIHDIDSEKITVIKEIGDGRGGNYFAPSDLVPVWQVGDEVILRNKSIGIPLEDLNYYIPGNSFLITTLEVQGSGLEIGTYWQDDYVGFKCIPTDLEWIGTGTKDWLTYSTAPVKVLTAKEAKAKYKMEIYNLITK